MFKLEASYKPAGDQITAIKEILEQFKKGEKTITLLGATGTGKTFTMANIIQDLQVPTLILSHNKTLAAQLATEFKYFFPNNAVHYFVSYFDYYQPESYLPAQDLYIEKEATINQEIEMFRLGAMASLLTRKDVIIVASVSALYGLGTKDAFREHTLYLEVGKEIDRFELKKKLLGMQYDMAQSKIEQGTFDFRGEILDIFASTSKNLYRIYFNEDMIEQIQVKDSDTFRDLGNQDSVLIWPSSQYVQEIQDLENILKEIELEMNEYVDKLTKEGKQLEASRIKKRVSYDIRMIKETGFTQGIENYSVYFDKRNPGEPPTTIFDYFPEDCLVIVDESHMSLPQLRAMPQADRSRKINLIDHGFRLPSARDHRPLNFTELEIILQRKTIKDNPTLSKELATFLNKKVKPDAKTLFVSATPAPYELELNPTIVQQIIRPTGLLDPFTYIYPKSGDYELLLNSVDKLLQKKPYLEKFFDGYSDHVEKIFDANGVEEIAKK